jgi:hypothetical protein
MRVRVVRIHCRSRLSLGVRSASSTCAPITNTETMKPADAKALIASKKETKRLHHEILFPEPEAQLCARKRPIVAIGLLFIGSSS